MSPAAQLDVASTMSLPREALKQNLQQCELPVSLQGNAQPLQMKLFFPFASQGSSARAPGPRETPRAAATASLSAEMAATSKVPVVTPCTTSVLSF